MMLKLQGKVSLSTAWLTPAVVFLCVLCEIAQFL